MAIVESQSELTTLQYGVPQGSVLGPVLFAVYTGTLAFFVEALGVSYQFFAVDIQLYIRVEDIDEAKHRLSSLLSYLKIWVARKKLKLHDGKSEIIVISGNLRNVSVPSCCNEFWRYSVPYESTKNLGVVLSSLLSFRSHIDSIVKTCNFFLYSVAPWVQVVLWEKC